jgi:hypothetical protein
MIFKLSVAVGSSAHDLIEVSRAIDLSPSGPPAELVHALEAHVRASTACLAEQLCSSEPFRTEEFVPLAQVLAGG